MSISKLWIAALATVALAVAGHAQAVPTLYEFSGGSATIRLTVGASTLAASTPLALDGVFATFDGDGDGALTDFEFSLAPEQAFVFAFPLDGYDSILIHSATLTPGVGYAHTFQQNNGGGSYNIVANPILTTTFLDVLSSSLGPGATQSFMFAGNSIDPLVASIDVATGTTFTLDGIALGAFTNADFPTIPVGTSVVVKLDLAFEGMIPVPEPTTGVLFGLGVAGLAALRSRRI
ncbi:MAG: PEP-CTERM sorting domain-containing protein [Myxococcota bacterium]